MTASTNSATHAYGFALRAFAIGAPLVFFVSLGYHVVGSIVTHASIVQTESSLVVCVVFLLVLGVALWSYPKITTDDGGIETRILGICTHRILWSDVRFVQQTEFPDRQPGFGSYSIKYMVVPHRGKGFIAFSNIITGVDALLAAVEAAAETHRFALYREIWGPQSRMPGLSGPKPNPKGRKATHLTPKPEAG